MGLGRAVEEGLAAAGVVAPTTSLVACPCPFAR